MIFLRIIQGVLILLFLYALWVQILRPLVNGTKFFPMWSSRRKKAVETIIQSNDEVELQKIEAEANRAKERAQPRNTN